MSAPYLGRIVYLALLLPFSSVVAAVPFQVRILAVGNGNVVTPNKAFSIDYEVTQESLSDHYYYVDGSLKLTRANSVTGGQAGRFSVTYPGGLGNGTVKQIAICLVENGDQVCDQIRVRGGYLLQPPQSVEMHRPGEYGFVVPGEGFNIFYDVLQPGDSDHFYYVDGNLKAVHGKGQQPAKAHVVAYPGGFAAGSSHELKACVLAGGEEKCASRVVTAGPRPPGIDLPPALDAPLLETHFHSLVDCEPACGYYGNVYYGDPSVSWVPAVGPDSEPNGLRVDLYYPGGDGRVHTGEPNTLVLYAHSANYNKESVRGSKKSTIEKYLEIQSGAGGVTVAALDFRHPLMDQDANGYPLSVNDLSHAVQFFRYYADIFNINPDDIFLTGSSLGAGVGIHAAVKELANPADPAPVRRVSSSVRGAFLATGQSSFSQQWFREQFMLPEAWHRYVRSPHDDENRRLYGHAIADVDIHAPLMELVYDDGFIAEPVSEAQIDNNSVDLTHLPNYGLAMQAQYRLHGIGDRIMVRENYGGSFGTESKHFIERNRISGN